MIPNNASREGTHIDPPTGAYEVYTYDRKSGTATLHLACGDDHGRAALAMRRAPGTACIARGGVVTSLASGTPANLVAGLKAAVKVAHASSATSAAPAVTTRPVEPPAAPVATTTAKPAEDPMPAKTTEAAPSCAKCTRYPVALTTAKTHAGTEEWCAHCRRVDAMRRNGTAFGRHAKAPKKTAPAKVAAKTSDTKRTAAVARAVAPVEATVAQPVEAVPATTTSDFATKVRSELGALGDMLIAKNAAYGNSALAPVRVFSRASTEEQLLVRIDDKLSRLARGAAAGEDVVRDLVGYLVLLLIARSAT
jgi:hypothetical protein